MGKRKESLKKLMEEEVGLKVYDVAAMYPVFVERMRRKGKKVSY